jgi:organic radical activating enzyme
VQKAIHRFTDSSARAFLHEVFSSIQGEGLLVGLRQIFVRFSGCTLTCDYCDTPESRVQSAECIVVGAYGSTPLQNPLFSEKLTEIINSFQIHPNLHHSVVESGLSPSIYTFPNPVSPERLTEIVNSFQIHPNLHHSISLTGGEPLEQVDFLKEWLPIIRRGSRGTVPDLRAKRSGVVESGLSPLIYLETNGILSSPLSEVIDLIDIIGMDIKLPSVAGVKALGTVPDLRTERSGVPSRAVRPELVEGERRLRTGVEAGLSPTIWDLHYDFLKIASKKEVFVKVVVSRNVTDDDIMQAINLVSSIKPDIPFIFQPKTPLDMNAGELLHLQEIASGKLSQVRVIPQVHKLLNLK